MAGTAPFRRRVLGITVAACVAVAGCSGQAPTAPDRVGAAAVVLPSNSPTSLSANTVTAEPKAKVGTSLAFDLLEGTVTLTLADGSELRGRYRGSAVRPSSGQPRATFDGVVTGGTGFLSGASGTLSGTGTGGFVDDGKFSVALRAAIATVKGGPLDMRVTLRGVSTSTCTTTAPPRMSLIGAATTRGPGATTGRLEHDLGTRPCAIIVE